MQVHALLRVRGAVAPWAVEPLHLPAAGAPVRHLRAELEGVTTLQGHGHRQLRAARVQLRVLAFAGPPGAVVVKPSHRVVAGGADAIDISEFKSLAVTLCSNYKHASFMINLTL